MKIRIRLILMQEIERRNAEKIEAYKSTRKSLVQPRKEKPMRNKAKHE